MRTSNRITYSDARKRAASSSHGKNSILSISQRQAREQRSDFSPEQVAVINDVIGVVTLARLRFLDSSAIRLPSAGVFRNDAGNSASYGVDRAYLRRALAGTPLSIIKVLRRALSRERALHLCIYFVILVLAEDAGERGDPCGRAFYPRRLLRP
jgi:hypothetical protein